MAILTSHDFDSTVQHHSRHHHYYHYVGSFLHLTYAEHLRAAGKLAEAEAHYKEALFQDHQNEDAANWRERTQPATYQEHLTTGAVAALAAYEAGEGMAPDESLTLLAGGHYEKALSTFQARHEAYHLRASSAYTARGKAFMAQEQWMHAFADFTKALDLNKHNIEARTLRDECLKRQKEVEA